MPIHLLKPKIINIVDKFTRKKPKSLLDYKEGDVFENRASAFGGAISRVMSDHEIKLLLLWAIISPAAALAYLIWIKYPEFRVFALPLFAISIVQFISQWSGFYGILQRMGVVPT